MMRTLLPLFCLCSLLLAGCESLPEAVHERFSPVPPKVRVFTGDVHTVFAAAKLAFKRLDFELTDTSGAPSKLEASSRILTSDPLGDSRQTVMNLHLHETAGGTTEVAALILAEVENASTGALSSVPKREHVFYDAFFTALETALQEQAKEAH